MDHSTAQTLKFWAILAICSPLQAQVGDPTEILIQARDRILEAASHSPKFSCTMTADRTYFSRVSPAASSATSCDQIRAARKDPRYKLQIDATDRIRLKVLVRDGREVFAWSDPLKFESHDLEEVLDRGPMGTGALGGYFRELFGNPEAHFQYLGEKAGKLEYGFQTPAGPTGSFLIDPRSLDPEHFLIEASALPRETSMCESTSTIDYHRVLIGKENILLPQHAESSAVMASTQETRSVVTYSSCAAELPSLEPPVKAPSILPENYHVTLALDNPIDADTVAAGDVVSATVSRDVVSREGLTFRTLLHEGARVSGRIVNVGWYPMLARPSNGGPARLSLDRHFVIAISFDVVEINGIASPLHMRFDRIDAEKAFQAVLAQGNRWPENSMLFKTTESHYVVPSGSKSEWVTVK